MKCIKCGAELNDNTQVCPYCLTGQEKDEQVKRKVNIVPTRSLATYDYTDTYKTNQKYFDIFRLLPFIVAGLILLSCFILGIVSACTLKMFSNEGFVNFIVWFAIGIFSSALSFILLRISYSYQLLHITTIQKIAEDNIVTNQKLSIVAEKLENLEIIVHVEDYMNKIPTEKQQKDLSVKKKI